MILISYICHQGELRSAAEAVGEGGNRREVQHCQGTYAEVLVAQVSIIYS